MRPDALILWIGSLLCIAVVLCAIAFVILRRRRSLRVCGIIVAALSVVVIADVIVADVIDPAKPATVTTQAAPPRVAAKSTPEAARAPVPTPTPARAPRPTRKTDTAPLRTFRTYWADVVRVTVSAVRAHDRAGEYLRDGSMVDASDELKRCQDTASGIVSGSVNLPLDTKNGSDVEFLAAVNKIGNGLRAGCKSARSYLDTSAPADFSATKKHFDDVVAGIVRSEALARTKYQRLGGDPNSLLSFKTALR